MKRYYCKYCGNKITRYSANYGKGGCRICSATHATRNKKKFYCEICGKEISRKAKRCNLCVPRGAKKGHEVSKATREKIRQSLKGRKRPEISGENHYLFNPNKNKTKCFNCGKEISPYAKCCWDCYIDLGLNQGKNAPNYVHGLSPQKYPSEFNPELKAQIHKRDDYECQNCGMTEEKHLVVYGMLLDVHHIDYNIENCQENNLIALCKPCNLRANFNRKHWQEYFEAKIQNAENPKQKLPAMSQK